MHSADRPIQLSPCPTPRTGSRTWIDIDLDAARPGAAAPPTASLKETDRGRPDPVVRPEQDAVWDEINLALDGLVPADGTADEPERPAGSARTLA